MGAPTNPPYTYVSCPRQLFHLHLGAPELYSLGILGLCVHATPQLPPGLAPASQLTHCTPSSRFLPTACLPAPLSYFPAHCLVLPAHQVSRLSLFPPIFELPVGLSTLFSAFLPTNTFVSIKHRVWHLVYSQKATGGVERALGCDRRACVYQLAWPPCLMPQGLLCVTEDSE